MSSSYVNLGQGFSVSLQQTGNTTPKAQEANNFTKYESLPKASKNKGKGKFVPV
jgi:hypothetical protein